MGVRAGSLAVSILSSARTTNCLSPAYAPLVNEANAALAESVSLSGTIDLRWPEGAPGALPSAVAVVLLAPPATLPDASSVRSTETRGGSVGVALFSVGWPDAILCWLARCRFKSGMSQVLSSLARVHCRLIRPPVPSQHMFATHQRQQRRSKRGVLEPAARPQRRRPAGRRFTFQR